MSIPGQSDRVEKVTELLGEVSRNEGACSKVTSSAGGCFPRGSIFPSYPVIKLVTQLDFREMRTMDSIMGILVSPDKLHNDVSDTVSQDTAGSRM